MFRVENTTASELSVLQHHWNDEATEHVQTPARLIRYIVDSAVHYDGFDHYN